MKNVLFRGVGLMAFLLFASLNAFAQSSMINKVLADTTFLKATEVTLEPGQKTDMHSHPAHFVYAFTDGTLLVHFKDGKEEKYDLKKGLSMAAPPEAPHVSENGGKTTIKFLIVELKDYPYKGK